MDSQIFDFISFSKFSSVIDSDCAKVQSRGQDATHCMWKKLSHISERLQENEAETNHLENGAKMKQEKAHLKKRNDITALTCSNGGSFPALPTQKEKA